MNIPELQQKISTLEADRDRLRTKMEPLVSAILSETSAFLQHFLDQETHDAIERFPDRVKALNPAALHKVKQEITELRNQLPQIVTERLKSDAHWMHRQELQIDFSNLMAHHEVNKKQLDMYDESLRLMMGMIGSVLANYKLVDGSCWKSHSSGSLRWSIGYTRTPALDKELDAYSSALERYVSLEAHLNKTKREKEQAEANDLWNKV